MISCIIIDDEPLAVDLLSDYASRLSNLEVKNSFTNPISALTYLKENRADVLFLDIQMPELNGLDFIRIIGQEQAVVLTTAYGEYALESYEFRVFDFLLKPISFERFEKSVQKVSDFLDRDTRPSEATGNGDLESAEAEASNRKGTNPKHAVVHQDTADYIFVKSGQQTLRVDLPEITHISSDGDYAVIFKTSGSKVLTLENLGTLTKRLPTPQFARIHRSHVVSLRHIDYIERKRVAIANELLPISESYSESFSRALSL
ncbi:MAG: response regulator transcription factor [Bacteroidota bacterium]